MDNNILVIVTETSGDALNPSALEALGAAAELAGQSGGGVFALVRDAAAAPAVAACGVATVHAFDSPPSNETLVATCAGLVADHAPAIVIVNRGPDVLEIAPRLAARTNGSSINGVVEATVSGDDVHAVAAVFGGAARAEYRFNAEGPVVMTLAPGAVEQASPSGTAGTVVSISAPAGHEDRVKIVEPVAEASGPRLEDARIVVSGGRGLQQAERYQSIRELAAAMGGMPGASRAIVDDGWATPAEQVGLTGTIVTPDLYVAIGISGASQHLAGCSSARTLVAVNTDAEAPIFKYAHYGIVDDGNEVLDELLRLTKDGAGPGA